MSNATNQVRPSTYIIVMRLTRYWLVGPFSSHEAAGEWARANNPADDPRWQTIDLVNPDAAPDVRSPDAGPMEG